MTTRKATRIAVDAAMAGLMLYLASYPLTRGLLRHGACGCLLVGLFLCHHLLNAGWYRALGRGRWGARRILSTATATLLLAASLALVASGLAMAGEVFPFLPFPMAYWGRDLHTTATAWCFVLASFHLGLHGQWLWDRARRLLGRAWPLPAAALMAHGMYALASSGLAGDLLYLGEPKVPPGSLPMFFVRYLGIGLAFCLLGRLLLAGLERFGRDRTRR